MCTIFLAFRVHPHYPLILAANRDELYARPASTPERLVEEPAIFGGRDLEKGGTWLGINQHGLVAGLTNIIDNLQGRRSRGQLVIDALYGEDPDDASEAVLQSLARDPTRGFNLLLAGPEAAKVIHAPKGRPNLVPLKEGHYVIPSNGEVNDPSLPRVNLGLAQLEEALQDQPNANTLLPRLRTILSDHSAHKNLPDWSSKTPLGPKYALALQQTCVHTPIFGTHSSTVLLMGHGGFSETRYFFRQGAPCQGPLLEKTSLLRSVRQEPQE